MNCKICENYMEELDTCKFCHFEYDRDYCKSDDWDILDLKDEDGWTHLQIRDRLFSRGVECLKVDIFMDDNIAYIIGHCDNDSLARILNIHREVIYNDFENGLIIINLFQEKYLRGLLDDRVQCSNSNQYFPYNQYILMGEMVIWLKRIITAVMG